MSCIQNRFCFRYVVVLVSSHRHAHGIVIVVLGRRRTGYEFDEVKLTFFNLMFLLVFGSEAHFKNSLLSENLYSSGVLHIWPSIILQCGRLFKCCYVIILVSVNSLPLVGVLILSKKYLIGLNEDIDRNLPSFTNQ